MEDKNLPVVIARIDERQKAHDEILKDMKGLMSQVLDQVKKTNGKVLALEKYRDMIADPCIKAAEKRAEQIEELFKYKESVTTGTKVSLKMVSIIVTLSAAVVTSLYTLWSASFTNSIVEKIKAEYTIINQE